MNENQCHPKENPLLEPARRLGRTRSGQMIGAIVVAAFTLGLGYLFWLDRDTAAFVFTSVLIFQGIGNAWRLLPIPAGTRSRWALDKKIAEDCPAYFFFKLAFYGGPFAVYLEFWKRGFSAFPGAVAPLVVFTVIGSVSYFLCRRFIHRTKLNAIDAVRS